jgi:hypothetical protein
MVQAAHRRLGHDPVTLGRFHRSLLGSMVTQAQRGKCRALVLTQSPHSFFTKLFNKRVNTRASARGSTSVTFGPRARRELLSSIGTELS